MSAILSLLSKGSFWGIIATIVGFLNSQDVLSFLPPTWAHYVMLAGTIVAALSSAIHAPAAPATPAAPPAPPAPPAQ